MSCTSDRRLPSCFVVAVLCAVAVGCGDDGDGAADAGDGDSIDATPAVDADLSGACANAAAGYAGVLENPTALDDGQELVFFVDVDTGTPPDRLRLAIAEGAPEKVGDFDLPNASWSVSICLDDTDGSCAEALVASSGVLHVSSVSGRFQASIEESSFVDDPDAPTCSATLGALSFDVAIDSFP